MKRVSGPIRKSRKHGDIVDALRRQILDKTLTPGQQFPSRRQLEQTFQVSPPTLQRAVDQLVRDGFVTPIHGRGTYVAEKLPHLCNYALIFPHYPGARRPVSPYSSDENPFLRFWSAMREVSVGIEREGSRQILMYYGVDGHVDAEDYQRLIRDIKSHRLAGLIYAAQPSRLVGTPLLEEPGLPRVAVMGKELVRGIPAVAPDNASLLERALDYFQKINRKRLAVLGTPGLLADMGDWNARLASRGMMARPHWQQFVSLQAPQFARNGALAMVHGDQSIRPDALFISDDNLVEYAMAGIIDAGIKVPDELELVVHCNFPSPAVNVLPAQRLGFDIDRLIRACLGVIDQQRKGEVPPERIAIGAQFEEELRRFS